MWFPNLKITADMYTRVRHSLKSFTRANLQLTTTSILSTSHPHCPDGEDEAQRGEVAFPRPHSLEVQREIDQADLCLNLGSAGCQLCELGPSIHSPGLNFLNYKMEKTIPSLQSRCED